MYYSWNKLLFNYFFTEERAFTPVTLYVDKALLDEEGKSIGGSSSFIDSIVIVDDLPRHLVDRFQDLFDKYDDEGNPSYFGIICLTILAWTVDAHLHGGNFYSRLNGLLEEAYKRNDPHLNLDEVYDFYHVGQGVTQGKDSRFRALLEESFSKLQAHVNETLGEKRGKLLPRRVGHNTVVGIPRAHALVNAMDRERLERLFFERGIHPGTLFTLENAEYLLQNGGLGYLSSATRAKWTANDDNKQVIKEILCSLIEFWDGTFVEEIPERSRAGKGKGRQPAAQLVPILKSGGGFSRQIYKLGARIEFYNSDFPVESSVEVQEKRLQVNFHRQIGGWSGPVELPRESWNFLLNRQGNSTFLKGNYRVNFISSPVYLFEISSALGGYVPARKIVPRQPYLVLVNEQRAESFLDANRHMLGEKVEYEPGISGWTLFKADEGIESFEGLERVYKSRQEKFLEIQGGAKIGHGARKHFSAIVPPVIHLVGELDDGFFLACRYGKGELERLQPDPDDPTLFELPSSLKKTTRIEVVVCNENEEVQEDIESVSFTLEEPSMRIGLELSPWSVKNIVQSGYTGEYLYNTGNFEISFEGGEPLTGDGNYLSAPGVNLPTISVSHLLQELEITVNGRLLGSLPENRHVYRFPSIPSGQYEVIASWHGLEIEREKLALVEIPRPEIEVMGARRDDQVGNEIWIVEKNDVTPSLKVTLGQQFGPGLKIILNGTKVGSLVSGSKTLKCPREGKAELKLRWGGRSLKTITYQFSLPIFSVSLDKKTGRQWGNSDCYDPENPPGFILTQRHGTPEINTASIHCILDSVELEYMGTAADGSLAFHLPKGHGYTCNNCKLSVYQDEKQLPLAEQPIISLIEKPTVTISFDGQGGDDGVFTKEELPKILVTLQGEKCNDSRSFNYIKLQSSFGHELIRATDGSWELPYMALPKDNEKLVCSITATWCGEPVATRQFAVVRKAVKEILLGDIIFPEKKSLVSNQYVFLNNNCPNTVRLVNYPAKYEKSYSLVFLLQPSGLRVPLPPIGNFEYDLGSYEKISGKSYIIEVWGGKKYRLAERKFFVAGKRWVQLGFMPGMVLSLEEEASWLSCWFVEKSGRRSYRVYSSQNCPLSAETEKKSCPCVAVKAANSSKHYSKKLTKLWQDIVHHKKVNINDLDRQQWNSFKQAKRSP